MAVVALGLSFLAPQSPVHAGAPYFEYRGIIEGYYGTPFSHSDRLDLVRWEALHGMNIFVHAPRSDPYVRTLWRHQYPSDQLQAIVSEIALAGSLGVLWVPDVGPGGPLLRSPNVGEPGRLPCSAGPGDWP